MKKFLSYLPLSAAALVALSFAACTDSDVVSDGLQNGKTGNLENAIQFSTYLGRSTRAGQPGPIDTDVLKGANYGFGVFGYYTGTQTYSDWATGYASEETPTDYQTFRTPTIPIANYMFNQKVYWDGGLGDEYITKGWTYTPLKYWPNEVGGTDAPDDDQNDNTKSDPATGSGFYGGNMTFFAYAPYVDFPITGEDGIIAINATTALTIANVVKEEPTITYVASTDPENIVDLLWGTKGGTSTGVYGAENAGVSYSESGTNWQKTILKHGDPADGYTMLADLTKQKTDGTVDILFKHALGKIGGSSVTQTLSGGGTSDKNGLMVVLDLDDLKGGETGGEKEDATKVTITDITIAARTLIADANNKKPGEEGYESTYLKKNQGRINLATGQWKVMKDISGSNDNITVWNKGTSSFSNDDPATTTLHIGREYTSKLADNLQEPAEVEKTATAFDALPAGVTTSMQNVYGTEASPLVYIPSTYPELTISVDYTVRTKDANLGEAFSEVRQKITKKVTLTSPIELNKMYNILIHLGLTSVKFTANVSDWEVDKSSSSGTGEDLDDDGVIDLVVQDAYLPINVGSYNNAITLNYSNGETPVAMTAGTDKSIVNLGSKDVLNYTFVSAKIKDNKGTGVNDITEGTYTLSTDATSWITIGADKKISASANTTFAARTGSVYIEYNGEKYEFLRIEQAGRKATSAIVTYAADPTTTFNHNASGAQPIGTVSTFTINYTESDNSTVGTSTEYHLDDYTQEWNKAWASGDATSVTLENNTEYDARTAKLNITIGDQTLTVKKNNTEDLVITQNGNTAITSLTSDVNTVEASAASVTPIYTLKNSDNIAITPSGITYSVSATGTAPTINSSTGALTLADNGTTSNNVITITATDASSNTASCEITQRASGLTIADPSAFNPTAQGPTPMSLTVQTTVGSNVIAATACSYASNKTWAVVTNDGSHVNITLTANATGSARTATITVTKDDATGTFTITQNP